MIGIIPILFLIYFSILIYIEKTEHVALIGDHMRSVEQSAVLDELINELGRERRSSYQYKIKTVDHNEIDIHRIKTDSLLSILQKSKDLALRNFEQYTFLDDLSATRTAIDTIEQYPTSAIMQYYTDAVIRLNTINSAVPSSPTFLQPIYQDLVAQKLLSQIITFYGIIRANIYNALYTKQYMVETLLGTLGAYKVYVSYEKEFLLKASPEAVKTYLDTKDTSAYKEVRAYMDKLFTTFQFDSSYQPKQWWDASTRAGTHMRNQQKNLWKSVDTRMATMYQEEINSKNSTFIFLIVSILIALLFVAYSINHITRLLRELKLAARKISRGGTGLQLADMPRGVIGNLAKSIVQIDKNNLVLANAANEIGKGNFNVEIKPRSDEDLLSISIKKMKKNLREFTAQKDKVQQETLELVKKRDEFFSIASHELKTPVTSLKAYTQLLLMDEANLGDSRREEMLEKMDSQINKLTALINDLLDTSKLQNGQLVYTKKPFQFQEMVAEVVSELRLTATDYELVIENNPPAEVDADRFRIGQVLNNILTNAIRFGRDSKRIIVNVALKNDKLICSVRDFGSGINPEEQHKIFERFYRISGNNLHTYPGLGLGLYISREIIVRHGGKIWMTSEHGNGSTFYFELPVLNDNLIC